MSAVRSARVAVLAVAVVSLVLSGCGRRGPLEKPHAARKPEAAGTTVVVPNAVQSENAAPSDKPERPFILDPLI